MENGSVERRWPGGSVYNEITASQGSRDYDGTELHNNDYARFMKDDRKQEMGGQGITVDHTFAVKRES